MTGVNRIVFKSRRLQNRILKTYLKMANIYPSLDVAPNAGPSPRTIQDGDLVIVYENMNYMKAVTVKSSEKFDNRFGSFPHKVRSCMHFAW